MKYQKTSKLPNRAGFMNLFAFALFFAVSSLQGAGLLQVSSSGLQELQIRDHQVKVTINNGFAQTEVFQTFYNPNSVVTEALYVLPLPKHASLSEMEILMGEERLCGEVVPKEKAQEIYQQETAQGNEAGLAEKTEYQRFEFWVSGVPALGEAVVRTVYYQPVQLDTGVGSYLYPLEEGGTDEVAKSFWLQNDVVEGDFTIDVCLKSSWPVKSIRAPFHPGSETVDEYGNRSFHFQSQGGSLDKDFVFYYQLEDNLPGRVEVIPYRSDASKPGVFMMVVTPGIDLQPLDEGADYVFVLDVSGSMGGKLPTLVEGIKQTVSSLRPQDRFRIVLFNNHADELTKDWVPAVPEQVSYAIDLLNGIQDSGGTNLYAGLKKGLSNVDADRVTSLILVTDGVTNTGVLSPIEFAKLVGNNDVRIFGFLMGNSSNWALMDQICSASGGMYKSVSNSDDIIGQILLAKNKILHKCLHDVELNIDGVNTWDLSRFQFKKVFRGQQLVVLGKYADGGNAEFKMKCRVSGHEKVYRTSFEFPDVDTDHPELERIWALSKIEGIEWAKDLGLEQVSECEQAIEDLAVNYQIVTDYTSMIVLSDEGFARHGIERKNQARIAEERRAQSARAAAPAKSYRVDQKKNAFDQAAPRIPSGGGGAIHPFSLFALVLLPLFKKFKARSKK